MAGTGLACSRGVLLEGPGSGVGITFEFGLVTAVPDGNTGNGMEHGWNGMEWNGMEGMKDGPQHGRNGWKNGMEWKGMEWNGQHKGKWMEGNTDQRNGTDGKEIADPDKSLAASAPDITLVTPGPRIVSGITTGSFIRMIRLLLLLVVAVAIIITCCCHTHIHYRGLKEPENVYKRPAMAHIKLPWSILEPAGCQLMLI